MNGLYIGGQETYGHCLYIGGYGEKEVLDGGVIYRWMCINSCHQNIAQDLIYAFARKST
jgi:hypothetical protein